MDKTLLARADEIVASLSPGRQEMVREIVINSIQRGHVDESARRYLTNASGGPELAETLATALASPPSDGRIESAPVAPQLTDNPE